MMKEDTLSRIEILLEAIRCREKTPNQISDSTNIPIATVYRLIRPLMKANWIRIEGKEYRSNKYLSIVQIVRVK